MPGGYLPNRVYKRVDNKKMMTNLGKLKRILTKHQRKVMANPAAQRIADLLRAFDDGAYTLPCPQSCADDTLTYDGSRCMFCGFVVPAAGSADPGAAVQPTVKHDQVISALRKAANMETTKIPCGGCGVPGLLGTKCACGIT